MRRIWLIAWATILETLRRKDLYVLGILVVVIMAGAGMMNFFGISGLQKFLKDISLTVINFLIIVIAVTISARQLPYEFEHRTIYPLLAKPISRFHFLMGKFLGAFVMSAFTLVVLNLLFCLLAVVFQLELGAIFVQALYLRLLSLGIMVALTLCLSLFLTQSANWTIALLLFLGASMLGRSIEIVYYKTPLVVQFFLKLIYWVFPHVDFFDLTRKVVHGWEPIAGRYLVFLTFYALVYVGVLLFFAQLRFSRRAL